jgi:hypothetical protein
MLIVPDDMVTAANNLVGVTCLYYIALSAT